MSCRGPLRPRESLLCRLHDDGQKLQASFPSSDAGLSPGSGAELSWLPDRCCEPRTCGVGTCPDGCRHRLGWRTEKQVSLWLRC